MGSDAYNRSGGIGPVTEKELNQLKFNRLCSLLAAATTAGAAAWAAPVTQPAHQNYLWRHVTIIAGGFIPGIEFSPCKPGLMYCRTDMGGLYRWSAVRSRWVPLTDWVGQKDWTYLGGESIAPDPVDPHRVYAAVGMYTGPNMPDGAILRSTNEGRTSKITPMPFRMGGNNDGRSIGERLDIDPWDHSVLYFGSRLNGLWRSQDFGAHWNRVTSFPVKGAQSGGAGIGFVLFGGHKARGHGPSTSLYAGVSQVGRGIYHSSDGGKSWKRIAGQPDNLLPQHGFLTSSGILYVTFANGVGPNGITDGAVWKYDTANGHWTDISPVKPGVNGNSRFGYAGLAVDPSNPNLLVVSTLDRWNPGDNIYRSTNGGKTWSSMRQHARMDATITPYLKWGNPEPSFGWWTGCVAMNPFNPNEVLYGTGATIWGTTQAERAGTREPIKFTVWATGIEETAVICLLSPPQGAHLFSGLGDIGGFKHNDFARSPLHGMCSNPIFNNTTGLDVAWQRPSMVVRVGTGKQGMNGAISMDGGSTWKPFPSQPADTRGGGSVAVSANGSAILWSTYGNAPMVSFDRGASWSYCNGLPPGTEPVADRLNSSIFYALDRRTGAVYISRDGGKSFSSVGTVGANDDKLVASFASAGHLWAASRAGGLFHSTDYGRTFVQIPSVNGAISVACGHHAPGATNPAIFIVGTVDNVDGVFRSDDEGKTWVRISDKAHRYGNCGEALAADPRIFGRVYLGTNGRGIPYGSIAR